MTASLAFERRLTRAGQALGWLLLAVPLALLAVPALVALVAGAVLGAAVVGLPLLLAGAAACRAIVRLQRRLANALLGTRLAPLHTAAPPRRHNPWRWWRDLLGDPRLWRTVVRLGALSGTALAAAVAAAAPTLILGVLLWLGVLGVGGLGDVEFVGPWALGPALGVALLALSLPAAVLVLAILDALPAAASRPVRRVLAPRAAADGPVREILAESLGDRSVSVAYWLPEREGFVDETGRPIELPAPGSGRAWTAVERDGHRVAAILHDATLDTSRELVQAAAAASSLAIDNERLKADLRARVEELRVSRLRIVEAGDAARRRIERDLHDGAQQQLVALALQLRMLKARVDDAEVVPLVDQLSEQLAAALADLRELARGIHPSILSDRGLAPAIDALAGRTPLPVVSRVALEERLPNPVEAAVYFMVAEALTNVQRYARASSVRIDVRAEAGVVVVEVADDGVGGVDVGRGSGLRGLHDRLAAVDGTLDILSPPGGGTRLRARIPLAVTREAAA